MQTQSRKETLSSPLSKATSQFPGSAISMLAVLEEAGAIMPCTRWDMEIEPYFSSGESDSRLALIPKSASLPLRENMCLMLTRAVGVRGRAAELDKPWAYKT